jgi:hypothetical protein
MKMRANTVMGALVIFLGLLLVLQILFPIAREGFAAAAGGKNIKQKGESCGDARECASGKCESEMCA